MAAENDLGQRQRHWCNGFVVGIVLMFLIVAMDSHSTFFSSATRSLGGTTPTYDFAIRIDCGGMVDFTNNFNQTWIADTFFSGGTIANVSEPKNFEFEQEKTLRFFPIAEGKKNCYTVSVPESGRFYIRMFFVYDNYDNARNPPSFDVSVEGTVVFSWRPDSWMDQDSLDGAYSDLLAFIEDGDATVCLYSIGTDSPLIGALEIVQVDPALYTIPETGPNVVLVNYGRFTGGNDSFGSGLSKDIDLVGRAWKADTSFTISPSEKLIISTNEKIEGADKPPNYIPSRLYLNAHVSSTPDAFEISLPVDASLDYLIWLHFAEIDDGIDAPGQRVFDININNETAFTNVDIMKAVGKFAAYDLHYVARNLTSSTMSVIFQPKTGSPLISGLEIYALLSRDLLTDPTEVATMKALKESLQIPERMGWNGDPCAPSNWDSWEGVSCYVTEDKKALTITNLDLSSQGLKGFISEQITLLKNLQSLNLSNNAIEGEIPRGLGQNVLAVVDLSGNELVGTIPGSLGSTQLTVVFLNGNQLEGKVPLHLYSIGVHGGYVNLTDNLGLCGVPSLPECSEFWRGNQLSNGSKLGIAFAVIVVFFLALYFSVMALQRRWSDDYQFGLPHQLAVKGSYYQRHSARYGTAREGSMKFSGIVPDFSTR